MKLIRKNNADIKNRSDGRVVVYYTPIEIPKETKNIGLISVQTPKGCDEVLHKHPESTEIFFHFTIFISILTTYKICTISYKII